MLLQNKQLVTLVRRDVTRNSNVFVTADIKMNVLKNQDRKRSLMSVKDTKQTN